MVYFSRQHYAHGMSELLFCAGFPLQKDNLRADIVNSRLQTCSRRTKKALDASLRATVRELRFSSELL